MTFKLHSFTEHLFILGAGASVDYGLPTWAELQNSIINKINKSKHDEYQHNEEILEWLNQIGEGRNYRTIDECITMESVSRKYHSNGHQIENEIFSIIQDVFEEAYIENEFGWIGRLNKKIINNENDKLENKIVFIDYNYDDVLDRNFLNYSYLTMKHRLFSYRDRLDMLADTAIDCFHPHGYFSSEQQSPCIRKEKDTIKSDTEGFIDAVSCHDSKQHRVWTPPGQKIVLNILGLGNGLEVNLNKIDFQNQVAGINITIRNKERELHIINFLSSKFEIPLTEIKIFKDCNDLIDNCFSG